MTVEVFHKVKSYKGYQIIEVSRNATRVRYEVRKIVICNIDDDRITEFDTLQECISFVDANLKTKIMEKITEPSKHVPSGAVQCKRCECKMNHNIETHKFSDSGTFILSEYICPNCKTQIDSVIILN